MNRDVPERRQEELRRQLARYADTWRDSDFLDEMCSWAESGRRFTPAQADAISDALGDWQRRLTGPSHDPDRAPPGYVQLTWDLASHFRQGMEACGLACPSRREIYAELARVIARDQLRDNHEPWHDRDGLPGWYRMLHEVISAFIDVYADPDHPMRAARDLAQPGMIREVAGVVIEDRMLARLADVATDAEPYQPSPERRAAVRRYLQTRGKR